MNEVTLIGHALVLFAITFLGTVLACKQFAYNITLRRKAGSAACFAILNSFPIPLPVIDFMIPATGLYMCLMDNSYDRLSVNRVFSLTLVSAIFGILVVYSLQAWEI